MIIAISLALVFSFVTTTVSAAQSDEPPPPDGLSRSSTPSHRMK